MNNCEKYDLRFKASERRLNRFLLQDDALHISKKIMFFAVNQLVTTVQFFTNFRGQRPVCTKLLW